MADNSFGDLVLIIEKLRFQIRQVMPIIGQEIDTIIQNKVKSKKQIEFLLDSIMDYIPLGFGTDEFKRLNNYYRTFNTENALGYDRLYKQIFN